MSKSKLFQFKEFSIRQEKTAMKVGTDGVLLGAWAPLDNYPENILDVGTGTGVIALMLAQRSEAFTIDAVELDEQAYEEAVENFENSEWADRLFCYHSNFKEFAQEMTEEEESYDLIVSNPPFYTADFETADESRNTARFTSSLSFSDLLEGVVNLLSEQGVFALILPYGEEVHFIELALQFQLHLNRVCRIRGNVNSEIKRSMLTFSFTASVPEEREMIIEIERHKYTEDYIQLTKDFYLKMK